MRKRISPVEVTVFFVVLWTGLSHPIGAASQYVQEPYLDACQQWDDTVHQLECGSLRARSARMRFKSLWQVLRGGGAPVSAPWQWMFPLPGYDAGCFGESYDVDGYRFLDGPRAQGYPGLRLYIRDAARVGLEDRTGKAQPVVSAANGFVVSAEKHWKPGDPSLWGDYVLVFDHSSGLFFLYGGLARIRASPGQRVLRGEVVGWLGRTGSEVSTQDLGTQLRFEVHTFDDGLFYPVYPGRALRTAGHTEWPIPDGIVRPRFKVPPPAFKGDF